MFDNYFYLSSTSKQFRDHFVELAKEIKTNLKLKNGSVVVDLGSNDSIFLDPVQCLGLRAVGVEPAKNVAKIANKKSLKHFLNILTTKQLTKSLKNLVKQMSLLLSMFLPMVMNLKKCLTILRHY